jgi:hypothetical protein
MEMSGVLRRRVPALAAEPAAVCFMCGKWRVHSQKKGLVPLRRRVPTLSSKPAMVVDG